jgi:predicted transcriptional regulator of viral defense system
VRKRAYSGTVLHVSILERLLDISGGQHYLFTVSQARQAGVRSDNLRRLAAQGRVERRCQGVYRIEAAPYDELAGYMEATLWAKQRGVISGPSALALRDLADVNPSRIHLVVPPGYNPRRADRSQYDITRTALAAEELDEVDDIPTVSTAVAIRQSIDANVPGDLIEQAIIRALARELIGNTTAARLRVQMYDRNTLQHTT